MMWQEQKVITLEYIPGENPDDLELILKVERLGKRRGIEFQLITLGRFALEWTDMPRIISEEGYVVSGRENVRQYLNRVEADLN